MDQHREKQSYQNIDILVNSLDMLEYMDAHCQSPFHPQHRWEAHDNGYELTPPHLTGSHHVVDVVQLIR